MKLPVQTSKYLAAEPDCGTTVFIKSKLLSTAAQGTYSSSFPRYLVMFRGTVYLMYPPLEKKRVSGVYLPSQIRFPIGGRRVMCRWSKVASSLGRTKLTNAIGKQKLELLTHTWSGRGPWNRNRFVCQPASRKSFFMQYFFPYFWVGRYNRTLNDWPCGKQWFLLPLDLNVSRGELLLMLIACFSAVSTHKLS